MLGPLAVRCSCGMLPESYQLRQGSGGCVVSSAHNSQGGVWQGKCEQYGDDRKERGGVGKGQCGMQTSAYWPFYQTEYAEERRPRHCKDIVMAWE
jgi:hypothetical protein